jgi:hypothetical protein
VDHLIFSLAKNGGRKVAEASTEKSLHCNQKKKKKKKKKQFYACPSIQIPRTNS